MLNRNTFAPTFKPSFSLLGELVDNIDIGNDFTVVYAMLLYETCRFLIMSHAIGSRNLGDPFFANPISMLVLALKQSFLLCREVHGLFQEVSRFLAVLYTFSPSVEDYSILTSSSSYLSESQWASFFHQASIGAHVRPRLKQKDQSTIDADGSFSFNSTSLGLHRLPESVLGLEEYITKKFQGLPPATIVCISILKDEYTSWLKKVSGSGSDCVWMMLSRLNKDCEPIVLLLPVDILEGDEYFESLSSSVPFESKTPDNLWHCPWGHAIVNEIAPIFKAIFEGDFKTSKQCTTFAATSENLRLLLERREKLDQALCILLSKIEERWFGPWRYLLLGGVLEPKPIPATLVTAFQSKKSAVNENIIEAVIRCGVRKVECLSELILNKGCYFGETKCIKEAGSLSPNLRQLLLKEISEDDSLDREPVILVPDFDIQMLPWESLPLLVNQEVYRMPSVAGILCAYNFQKSIQKNFSLFPTVNPKDCFYVLNPGGDLKVVERELGELLEDLQGITGTKPSGDELSNALKSHSLYIYIGHGRGIQYISDKKICELNRCAAAILMGCSSGSVDVKGSYAPTVPPLHYMAAGSPLSLSETYGMCRSGLLVSSVRPC